MSLGAWEPDNLRYAYSFRPLQGGCYGTQVNHHKEKMKLLKQLQGIIKWQLYTVGKF